jgi:DNA-binding PadR family transcriptional regulator
MFRFHQHRHDHPHRGRHGFGWDGHSHMREMMRHGRGRRSERVFEQGDLRLLLLKLIADKPSHGYELIKAVEESVGGAYSPSPGVVYPTLTHLEDLGYTRVQEAEGGKKLFAITPEGEAYLAEQAGVLAQLNAKVDEIAAANRGRSAPQVVRAMENLRMALRMRLSRGPVTEEQVAAIAAALDDAARKVEGV